MVPSGGAEAICAFSEIFHDGSGAAFYGEDAGYLEDDVLGRGPAAELGRSADADELGHFQFPGQACHDVYGICAADTDRYHAQTACIGGMGVRTIIMRREA